MPIRIPEPPYHFAGRVLRREKEGSLDIIVKVLDDLIPRLDRRAKATAR